MTVLAISKNTTLINTPFGTPDLHLSGNADIEDVYLSEENADSNQRTVSPITLGASPGFRGTIFSRVRRLDQIPAGSTITEARIYFNAISGSGTSGTNAYALLRKWIVGGVTWNDWTLPNSPWTTAGALGNGTDRDATILDTQSVNGNGWWFWDITDFVQDIVNGVIDNNGIGLFGEVNSGFRSINGSYNSADGVRPEFHVDYVAPEGSGGFVDNMLKDEIPVNIVSSGLVKSGGTPSVPTVNNRTCWAFCHSLYRYLTRFTETGWWIGDIATSNPSTATSKGRSAQIGSQVIPPQRSVQFSFATNVFDPWPNSGPATTWASRNWDDVVIMASNFEQTTITPENYVANECTDVMDHIRDESPSSRVFVYEHWSIPSQYSITVTPPNILDPGDFDTYNDLHRIISGTPGTYHQWHLDFQDELISEYPTLDIYMIPVYPIIADLIRTESYMSTVEFDDLFEDDDPHGFPTVYFLAGLICYRAMYGQAANANYVPVPADPVIIPEVLNNLSSVISFIDARYSFYAVNGNNLP